MLSSAVSVQYVSMIEQHMGYGYVYALHMHHKISK